MDALYNTAKPRVVAIGGPTATGKTALSVALAKRFGGEIISADSMQIYQGLDVGTAKVTPEEMQGVPHHLVGFLAPEQAFSVADFTTLAGKTITQLTAQGKLPLVVGGTGLYITSLLNGIGFTPEKVDPAIRQELQARLQAEGSQALYAELAAVDPGYAAKVHPNNTPRVIRALELYRATGRKMSAEREAARPAEKPYRSLCLCLTCRDRTLLYQRIDTRCDRMMQSDILEEANWCMTTAIPTAPRRRPSATKSSSRILRNSRPGKLPCAPQTGFPQLCQASADLVPPPDGRCVALPGRRKPGTAGGRTDRSVPGGKQRLKCSNNIAIYKR